MNKLQKIAVELALMNTMLGGSNYFGLESFENKNWGKPQKTFSHGSWKPIKQSKHKSNKQKKPIQLKNRISKKK